MPYQRGEAMPRGYRVPIREAAVALYLVMISPSSETVGRPLVPLTLILIVCLALVDQRLAQTTRLACVEECLVSTVATFAPSMYTVIRPRTLLRGITTATPRPVNV